MVKFLIYGPSATAIVYPKVCEWVSRQETAALDTALFYFPEKKAAFPHPFPRMD
jgi:hypothetical protein